MIEKKKIAAKELKAVLIGIIYQHQTEEKLEEYLDELAFLAETAGIRSVKRFSQKLDKPLPGTFIGTGKLSEIQLYVEENAIELVIFDDELSPSQLRNIDRLFNPDEHDKKVLIVDRTNLILDIFAQRARTAHAKTQVDLAYYQYMLPRLKGMWTHLERQRGGTGTRGGSGEKEIETDARIVREKISLLKTRLKDIDKQMMTQRKNRGEFVRVSLVGYTNVGKSTIMNLISKSDVFAENKLFATLDTTVRKVVIHNLPFLLSDTVGFIRKLPTQLVESFKSTLDEVRESDLLLHVLDISHPQFEEQYNVVNKTLADIGAADKPTITIFNKIDNYKDPEIDEFDLTGKPQRMTLEDLEQSWMRTLHEDCIFISAGQKINISEFRELLYQRIAKIHQERYPYNHFLY
jgi:GTP-binding protein HflX